MSMRAETTRVKRNILAGTALMSLKRELCSLPIIQTSRRDSMHTHDCPMRSLGAHPQAGHLHPARTNTNVSSHEGLPIKMSCKPNGRSGGTFLGCGVTLIYPGWGYEVCSGWNRSEGSGQSKWALGLARLVDKSEGFGLAGLIQPIKVRDLDGLDWPRARR